ncbi:MAG: hypothetical protein ACR2MB_11275 [Acidimicrobiales bacterium]
MAEVPEGDEGDDVTPGFAGDPRDQDLRALLDDERQAEAVADRRRSHWLGRQASASGNLAGLLEDLGEREQLVTVTTCCARPLRGVVTTLGLDFCALRGSSGDLTLVALRSISSLRPEPGTGHPVGDRDVSSPATLAGVLGDLAAERTAASVHTLADEALTGTLQSVGIDLLTVATAAGDAIAVPLAAIADVVLA